MQKTIKIDGRDVRFKASMSLLYRFKNEFHRDILQVIWPILRFVLGTDKTKTDELNESEIFDLLKEMEITDLMNIIWTLAKTADESIPEPTEWFDSFEVFPIETIAPELFTLIIESMQSTEKFKKKRIAETIRK